MKSILFIGFLTTCYIGFIVLLSYITGDDLAKMSVDIAGGFILFLILIISSFNLYSLMFYLFKKISFKNTIKIIKKIVRCKLKDEKHIIFIEDQNQINQ